MKEPKRQRRNRNQAQQRGPFIQRMSRNRFAQTEETPFISRKPTQAVQTKLTIGQSGDKYEQEADQMADYVMRMPQAEEDAPMISRMHAGYSSVQRKCSACEQEEKKQKGSIAPSESIVQRMPEDEQEEVVQTKAQAGGPTYASEDLAKRLHSQKGQGEPLPADIQSQMERRMGADFSGVRVYTDSNAVQMSRELNAQAFTHGEDIYFNAGKYRPGTAAGKRLLGHEMTHVVQQRGRNLKGDVPAIRRKTNEYQIQVVENLLKDHSLYLAIQAIKELGLGNEEKDHILANKEMRRIALSTGGSSEFGDESVYKLMLTLTDNGYQNLWGCLDWMLYEFKENSGWEYIKKIVGRHSKEEKRKFLEKDNKKFFRNSMKARFSKLYGDKEIYELMRDEDYMGGVDLKISLEWMFYEADSTKGELHLNRLFHIVEMYPLEDFKRAMEDSNFGKDFNEHLFSSGSGFWGAVKGTGKAMLNAAIAGNPLTLGQIIASAYGTYKAIEEGDYKKAFYSAVSIPDPEELYESAKTTIEAIESGNWEEAFEVGLPTLADTLSLFLGKGRGSRTRRPKKKHKRKPDLEKKKEPRKKDKNGDKKKKKKDTDDKDPRWRQIKEAVDGAVDNKAKSKYDGFTKDELVKALNRVKRNFHKSNPKVKSENEAKWKITARHPKWKKQFKLKEVWKDRKIRWKKGRKEIRKALRKLDKENYSIKDLRKRVLPFKDKYKYSTLVVKWDESDQRFEIDAAMSPDETIATKPPPIPKSKKPKWSGSAENNKKMEIETLSSKPPTGIHGSPPGSTTWPAWEKVRVIRNKVGKPSLYVRGHLLSDWTHGPGKAKNLTPLSRRANTKMERQVERFLPWQPRSRKVFKYTVLMTNTFCEKQKTKPLRRRWDVHKRKHRTISEEAKLAACIEINLIRKKYNKDTGKYVLVHKHNDTKEGVKIPNVPPYPKGIISDY